MDSIKALSIAVALFLLFFCVSAVDAQAVDASRLLVDIPEPPGARAELPSPVPMVYDFMGALMEGRYDVCMANYDIGTFLTILFDRQLARFGKNDFAELYSYQIQAQRNEFRFLAQVMNRVAKGARINYSDPRYHQQVQSKINVQLQTNRGNFEFVVYSRFLDGRWYVYDYVLNEQRLSRVYLENLRNVGPGTYLQALRPFYTERRRLRPVRNRDFDFSIHAPSDFEIKESVSEALLATVSAFDGQFLLQVQGATYDEPQDLSQVAVAIKESLMPFQPRLYDQWKSEIAGVEIGHVLFHFLNDNRRLFNHMVIIPLGRKLIVLNFYHNTLEMMKHMTNLREKMLDSLGLPQLEAKGGLLPGEFPDDLYSNDSFGSTDYGESSFGEITITPSGPTEDYWDTSGYNDPGYYPEPEIPPPAPDEVENMLQPDSYWDDSVTSDYPEPPGYDDFGYDDDIPPPPPPGSYGDGGGFNDDDYYYDSGGSEVSF